MDVYRLSNLIAELKKFKGFKRKSRLGEILEVLGETSYDDAGFFDAGGMKVVVSCDGIVEHLVRSNPRMAGYYSVLTNVNDVVAKGAKPIGFVDVISSRSSAVRISITTGILEGVKKYGLKVLKGHTHTDTSYDSINAAVIGIAQHFLPSTAARPGDTLIAAIDIEGRLGSKAWLKTFDSTTLKSSREVIFRLESMIELANTGLATAAKDVSGQGIVGTIAMLCESSGIGSKIKLEDIPKPEHIKLKDWLTVYPGIGFVITTSQPEKCINLLREHKLSAEVIGKTTSDRKVWLAYGKQCELFLDLNHESVFGSVIRR